MKHIAVIGLGFGDEGKGLTTAYLAAQELNSIVVRFSGGQQAGHTVHKDGVSHVFSNFGSGTLEGTPTFWSKFCTFDPKGVIIELRKLRELGIKPKLYIDNQCPVTTPFDKLCNQRKDLNNGTCGTGVGPTWQREEDFYSLKVEDLFFPTIVQEKIKNISMYYGHGDPKHAPKSTINYLNEFYDFAVEVTQVPEIEIVNGDFFLDDPSIQMKKKIFESSQGLLLDQNIGFFPNVTRSNVDTTNIQHFLKEDDAVDLYFVTRAYSTRHGNGPMFANESPINIDYPNETNVNNEFQGAFRKAILNVDLLRYAITKENNTRSIKANSVNLMITCLDHISDGKYQFVQNDRLYVFYDPYDFAKEIMLRLPGKFQNAYLSFAEDGSIIKLL